MVIQALTSKVVFLDTAPLIYFIEGSSEHQAVLAKLFNFNDRSGFSFITSTITLIEVLVKPLRENQMGLAQQYRTVLTTAVGIEVLDITTSIAEGAAQLRAKYNFRTPDAIQLATAIEAQADYFLTNDSRLKSVTEIAVLTVGDLQ